MQSESGDDDVELVGELDSPFDESVAKKSHTDEDSGDTVDFTSTEREGISSEVSLTSGAEGSGDEQGTSPEPVIEIGGDEEYSPSDEEYSESTEANLSDDEATEIEPEPRFGLGELLALMLDLKTAPHIVLLLVFSSILYSLPRISSSLATFSAIGFISLSVGYAVTAVMARWQFINRWVRIGERHTGSKLKSVIIHSVRSWSIPLLLTLGIGYLIVKVSSDNPSIGETLILALATLFVAWSIGQGVSFNIGTSSWLSKAESTLNPQERVSGNKSTIFSQLVAVGILATLLGYGFSSGFEAGVSVTVKWVVFIIISLAIQVGLVRYSLSHMNELSSTAGGKVFATRWVVISQLFVTWHIASAWRRLFGDGEPFGMLIEEFVLMVMTVLMAIWSLASRNVAGGGRLFTSENALFWGLSFGFGYAGSIAMLTHLTSSLGEGNLATTMAFGHSLTAVTVLVLHRRVLSTHAVRIRRKSFSEHLGAASTDEAVSASGG